MRPRARRVIRAMVLPELRRALRSHPAALFSEAVGALIVVVVLPFAWIWIAVPILEAMP